MSGLRNPAEITPVVKLISLYFDAADPLSGRSSRVAPGVEAHELLATSRPGRGGSPRRGMLGRPTARRGGAMRGFRAEELHPPGA